MSEGSTERDTVSSSIVRTEGDSARVLVIEDHELLAQTLVVALRADGLDARIAPELQRDAVLRAAEELRPDVALLDLHLGSSHSSLGLIAPLRERGAAVVMCTGERDRVQLAEAVEAGAIGVVAKDASFDELLAAIHEAVTLGTLLSAHDREELLAELRRQRAARRQTLAPFEALTPRERHVLAELMAGKAADTIATESFVSLATVRSQIRSVLLKLGVKSQLAAVALALEAGWTPDPDED